MVKIKFKTPVQIKGVDGDRLDIKPGIHELDKEVLDHWFVQGLIDSGQATILEQETISESIKQEEVDLSEFGNVKIAEVISKSEPKPEPVIEKEEKPSTIRRKRAVKKGETDDR